MLVMIMPGKGFGQLITEPFNYPVSATIGLPTQSSAVWINNNSGDEVLLTTGSLTYSGLPASTGNKIVFDSCIGGKGVTCTKAVI